MQYDLNLKNKKQTFFFDILQVIYIYIHIHILLNVFKELKVLFLFAKIK